MPLTLHSGGTWALSLDLVAQPRLAVRRQIAPVDLEERGLQGPEEVQGGVTAGSDRTPVRLEGTETIQLVRTADPRSQEHPLTGRAEVAQVAQA